MPSIFLSYSRVDRSFVQTLADHLRRLYEPGNVWFDEGLHGGDVWWDEILKQINHADIFIYVLSNESVQSAYCQAEFTEARRLQKPVITIQARDRTNLTEELRDIHYINMTGGVRDGTALTDLFSSINKQAANAHHRRPLWQSRTRKPQSEAEIERSAHAPPVTTPDLEIPQAEKATSTDKPWWRHPRVLLSTFLVSVITAVVIILNLNGNGVITSTPIPTLEIRYIVETLDARATIEAATRYAAETVEARATQYAAGTHQAGTITQAWINSWTDTPTPFPTFTANDQWTPIFQLFNGAEMVLVPPGCFMMGSETGKSNEQPAQEICFDMPYWIASHEVTNRRYGSYGNWLSSDRPRETVNWFDAVAHCESRGSRLPTEVEWEYAARGPDNLIYPWGNNFVHDNVTYIINSNNQTAAVGSRPGGMSWVGAYDLSGNVWEWVSSLYFNYPYDHTHESSNNTFSRVLRGGAWYTSINDLRAANRSENAPYGTNNGWGFRCARDYVEGDLPQP